jgi:site-specific recombinase XerD
VSVVAVEADSVERPKVPSSWEQINAAVPQLSVTMLAYLAQVTVSFRPSTIKATDTDLRIFAGFLIDHDPALSCVADIDRSHVEAFKIWQHAQPGNAGRPFKATSFRRRISTLRMFFIRIVEWDWNDAPARVPIFFGDVPKRDESLPKFLDDGDFTKFMRALADEPVLFRRLGVELLARTGMRVGELCDLEADAVTIMNNEAWLRIPVGKLHNDRYIPLHPHLVELIAQYQASDGPFTPGRLLSGVEGPLNRYAVDRWVKTTARRAGLTTNVHPHRLRHTFATQAINRGMTIEVIAALLGHRSLDMTRRYAQISNRVVADEYAAVAVKVEALYNNGEPLPADTIGPNMRRVRNEVHPRLLGNGWCQRPAQLDCSFESICESCVHFATDQTFQPIVLRQRNHAAANDQVHRAELLTQLLDQIDNQP